MVQGRAISTTRSSGKRMKTAAGSTDGFTGPASGRMAPVTSLRSGLVRQVVADDGEHWAAHRGVFAQQQCREQPPTQAHTIEFYCRCMPGLVISIVNRARGKPVGLMFWLFWQWVPAAPCRPIATASWRDR